MNQQDPDFGEILRRALRAEADTIEPADDGLTRIRARLTGPHSTPVAWITIGFSGIAGRARGGLQTAWEWLQQVPGTARDRFRAARPALQHPAWRPVAGLSLAAFIAIAAVFVFTPFPQHVFAQAVALIQTVEGGGPVVGTGGPQVTGSGTQDGGAAPVAGAASGKKHHNSAAPAHCATPASASPGPCPSACPSARASASPMRSASPMPSAGPTASPSRSACPAPPASPSPSPSSSPSPSPSSSPSPSPSPSASPSPSPSASPSSSSSPTPGATAPNPADSTASAPAGSSAPTRGDDTEPSQGDDTGPSPGG